MSLETQVRTIIANSEQEPSAIRRFEALLPIISHEETLNLLARFVEDEEELPDYITELQNLVSQAALEIVATDGFGEIDDELKISILDSIMFESLTEEVFMKAWSGTAGTIRLLMIENFAMVAPDSCKVLVITEAFTTFNGYLSSNDLLERLVQNDDAHATFLHCAAVLSQSDDQTRIQTLVSKIKETWLAPSIDAFPADSDDELGTWNPIIMSIKMLTNWSPTDDAN